MHYGHSIDWRGTEPIPVCCCCLLSPRCYLYMKTIERAHSPKNLWQRVKLNRNYAKALTQLDTHLEFWPKFLVHKNKQRLTKITQYLIRMKRLALKVKPKLVTVPARTEKRERRREAKAESAANIDREIEKELLQRLQSGTYADIYNFPVKQYNKVRDTTIDQSIRSFESLGVNANGVNASQCVRRFLTRNRRKLRWRRSKTQRC